LGIKTVMKVSSKTDYALRTVLELTRASSGEVVQVAAIAKRRHIPRKFLEQILAILKNGGIVGSRRGARGGYYLARPPSEVTLFEIISLMDHGLCRDAGPSSPGGDGSRDPFAEVWGDINTFISGKLAGITLQDMLDRSLVLDGEVSGNYVI
jgi:Rrf2 family protein